MIDDFEVKFRDIFSTPVYHIVSNKQDTSSIKKMCQWALEIEKEDKGIVVSNKINGYHSTPSANYNTIPVLTDGFLYWLNQAYLEQTEDKERLYKKGNSIGMVDKYAKVVKSNVYQVIDEVFNT